MDIEQTETKSVLQIVENNNEKCVVDENLNEDFKEMDIELSEIESVIKKCNEKNVVEESLNKKSLAIPSNKIIVTSNILLDSFWEKHLHCQSLANKIKLRKRKISFPLP